MTGLNALHVIVFRASGGVRGVWNKRINRLAHDHAALVDFLHSINTPNITEAWLGRAGLHCELLGAWWHASHSDVLRQWVMQSVTNTYPSQFKLHQWGLHASPLCPWCLHWTTLPLGTQGHIQGM
eukprot:1721551-Rhodomonas_salina.1